MISGGVDWSLSPCFPEMSTHFDECQILTNQWTLMKFLHDCMPAILGKYLQKILIYKASMYFLMLLPT